MRYVVSLIFIAVVGSSASQVVTINEFMSLNHSVIEDEDGDRSDWIELYNTTANTVDLSGWYLSDDIDAPFKWQIDHAELPPTGHLILFASSKDRSGPGQLHTNFKISSAGEMLLLSDASGALVHYILPITLSADISYGSITDGAIDEPVSFGQSSPGASNSEGVVVSIANDELHFSRPAGFYSEGFGLELSSTQGADIRYTTDGSTPTATSPLYVSAIELSDRSAEPNGISMIPTAIDWQEPRSGVEKATVIKMASFEGSIRLSEVRTATYFISARLAAKYEDLPVVSISLNADSLFDPRRGIYVEGEEGLENYKERGREWEREMYFEYFDTAHDRQLAQQVGGRIHGNSSREHSQKTLRLYARGEYGDNDIDYPFFEDKDLDEFKRILLRSSSTDFGNTMFKDILCSRLVKDLDIDYMAAQVCVVFINGEYWGVHSIRERIDEHYLAHNHGVDPDDLDLLTLDAEVEDGDASDYLALMDYVRTHDLSSAAHYDYVSTQVDISNFIDYNIAQLFLANYDWPAVNIRYWKGRAEGHKWRWIFYDADRCMVWPDHDYLWNYVLEDAQYNESPDYTTLLFNRLLENERFKEAFVQRFFYLLNTSLRSERILEELEDLERLYTPLMVDHIDRWSYPSSLHTWTESIDELRGFISKRPAIMVRQVMEYLGAQYTLYPNPVASGASHVTLDMEVTDDISTSIELLNSLGQSVYAVDLSVTAAGQSPRIPVNGLRPGIYVLRIRYGSLLFSEKLVIH